MPTLRLPSQSLTLPTLLGVWSAFLALSPVPFKAALLGVPVLAVFLWWTLGSPHRWLAPFFLCLLLTPPIPGPVGDAGLHAAPVMALIGLLIGAAYVRQWRTAVPPLAIAFGLFLAMLLGSVAFAAFYSGPTLAFGSLLRVGLFGIGVYVFLFTAAGPARTAAGAVRFARFLFLTACAAALFACADFYLQLPAPAGFEAQYVWLDQGVLRRAQGFFYEASTLGNFCAFFLVMIAVALFRPPEHSPCRRWILLGGGAVLVTALILSYSRASVLNVMVALVVLTVLRGAGRIRFRRPLVIAIVTAAAIVAVNLALPSFSGSYWARVGNTVENLWFYPDAVLSGRVNNWLALGSFLVHEPWHAIFGVGYKTLAYSGITGAPTIADNTYISMLVETGVIGFSAFILLNAAILRFSWRAAKASSPSTSFFGEWIFCFWAGQMVQMLSGDLMTYWRVLPVYFWVLGTAIRTPDANG